MHIRTETPARRCEICHQADQFDPETNACQRCENLTHTSVTYAAQAFSVTDSHANEHEKQPFINESESPLVRFFNPENPFWFGLAATVFGQAVFFGLVAVIADKLPHGETVGFGILSMLFVFPLGLPFLIAHYLGHRWTMALEIVACVIGSLSGWFLFFLILITLGQH